MLAADRVHFLLYGVGCLWSLLVWTVAAGLVGKWNSTVGCQSQRPSLFFPIPNTSAPNFPPKLPT